MHFLYLALILFSAAGTLILDRKYKLAFFYDLRRTTIVLSAGALIFSVWDFIGIGLGIFFSGQSEFMSGIYLAPEYPLEELIFLLFLCYFTLIIYRLWMKKWRLT